MNSTYYLFDMDGTLFFTDELNNESYNHALSANSFEPIRNQKRITREVVKKNYPEISEQDIAELIRQKQDYFIRNIKKVEINNALFGILQRIGKDKCVLWTSADRERTESIVNEFGLQYLFCKILHSDKTDISLEVQNICLELSCSCEQLSAFENDSAVVEELGKNGVSCFLLVSP